MRTLILMLSLIVLIAVPALAQKRRSLTDQLLSEPLQKEIYAPGVTSDATGKPLTRQPHPGQVEPVLPDPHINMGPDIFGPGINSDQYRKPAFGQPKQDDWLVPGR